MKKKEMKKNVIRIFAAFLCGVILLPAVSYLVPEAPGIGNTVLKAKNDSSEKTAEGNSGELNTDQNIPENGQGPYKVTAVKSAVSFIAQNENETIEVSLEGIKDPEKTLVREDTDIDPAAEAETYASSLLTEGEIYLVLHGQERDKKDAPLLACVYLEDGTFFNELMIRNGYGQVSEDVRPEHEETFLEAQHTAKELQSGLWEEAWKL